MTGLFEVKDSTPYQTERSVKRIGGTAREGILDARHEQSKNFH